ncbi:MAG: hypothetical protein MK214_12995 [Thalassotalea sp.]|nr:hypothetical protein [Thalassotalea sp.]
MKALLPVCSEKSTHPLETVLVNGSRIRQLYCPNLLFIVECSATKNYDTWAFGIFAYNVFFGEMPFELNDIKDVTQLSSMFVHKLYSIICLEKSL